MQSLLAVSDMIPIGLLHIHSHCGYEPHWPGTKPYSAAKCYLEMLYSLYLARASTDLRLTLTSLDLTKLATWLDLIKKIHLRIAFMGLEIWPGLSLEMCFDKTRDSRLDSDLHWPDWRLVTFFVTFSPNSLEKSFWFSIKCILKGSNQRVQFLQWNFFQLFSMGSKRFVRFWIPEAIWYCKYLDLNKKQQCRGK